MRLVSTHFFSNPGKDREFAPLLELANQGFGCAYGVSIYLTSEFSDQVCRVEAKAGV
jgi:hypothetical protein